jgi:hypothetical protein
MTGWRAFDVAARCRQHDLHLPTDRAHRGRREILINLLGDRHVQTHLAIGVRGLTTFHAPREKVTIA